MLLFVYGTLQKGEESHNLIQNQKFIDKAYIDGSLYDLGVGYPALTLAHSGRVYGEVYEVNPDIIEQLDEFEGYYPDDPDESIYFRDEMEVTLSDGSKTLANVYYMDEEGLSVFFATPIPDGRWK